MSRDQWLELYQLAERLCPGMLPGLPALTVADALGVLAWLRRLDAERRDE